MTGEMHEIILYQLKANHMKGILMVIAILLICLQSYGQKPRARDLGIPFVGTTGEFNAITDVEGVEVGYSTIISGYGENIIGE